MLLPRESDIATISPIIITVYELITLVGNAKKPFSKVKGKNWQKNPTC